MRNLVFYKEERENEIRIFMHLQEKTLWTVGSQRFFQDKKASTDYN